MRNDEDVHFAIELDQADEDADQRRAIDQAARRRQLHREREEEHARVGEDAAMPPKLLQLRMVDGPGKKPVGLRRLTREQPLQFNGREPVRVRLEEMMRPARGSRKRRHPLAAHRRIPSSPPTRAKQFRANCSSSRVCVAVTIVRTRAFPRATVGKPMPWAKTPSSNSRSENFIASAASPTITGVIGLSLTPVSKPSACRPDLKKRALSHSWRIHCGSLSRTSSAARHVAATDGGCDVEKRNGRAR